MLGARTCIYAYNKRYIMAETNPKTHMCHIINDKFITGGCTTKIILGLFTTAPIPQYQVLCIYVGVYRSDTRQNNKTPMDDQFTFPEYNMSLDTCAPYGDMYIDSNQLGNQLNFINNATVLTRIHSNTCRHTQVYCTYRYGMTKKIILRDNIQDQRTFHTTSTQYMMVVTYDPDPIAGQRFDLIYTTES